MKKLLLLLSLAGCVNASSYQVRSQVYQINCERDLPLINCNREASYRCPGGYQILYSGGIWNQKVIAHRNGDATVPVYVGEMLVRCL